jgi:hypothetical protein
MKAYNVSANTEKVGGKPTSGHKLLSRRTSHSGGRDREHSHLNRKSVDSRHAISDSLSRGKKPRSNTNH